MAIMRERVPRPATRNFTRGEILGLIGLSMGAVSFAVLVGRKVNPDDDPDQPLNCATACPCDCGIL